jgi:5-carboxymethyl-2-hydroxymuconate isomerase
MPHFIAECTDNIREQADLPGCSPKSTRRWPPPASSRSAASAAAPLAGHLADGRRQAGLRLCAYDAEDRRGRSLESREDVGEMLFALIKSHFAALMESRYLALSFELEELHPTLNYKQNNVHALFK